jgi:hypothetical protein
MKSSLPKVILLPSGTSSSSSLKLKMTLIWNTILVWSQKLPT